MLLIRRYMDLWKIRVCICFYVRLINCCFHLFRSSAFSFSSQYILLCLKASRSCVLLITPFHQSFFLQWHHEGCNFFSKYHHSNWILYEGYYLEMSSSVLYIQKLCQLLSLAILSSPLFYDTKFQSSPNSSTPILLVSRTLSYIKHCSKHNT